jgi:hypothetical protein
LDHFEKKLRVALALAVVLTACGSPTLDRSAAIYPVWWSGALNLAMQTDVEARLLEPFPEGVDEQRTDSSGRVEKATADNCVSLLRLRREGFVAKISRDLELERYLGADCLTLEILKKAEPAKMTFLAQFRLDDSAADLLPPTLAFAPTTTDTEAVEAAAKKGLAWRQYDPGMKSVRQNEALVLHDTWWRIKLQIYARGDFNSDGIEDVVIRTDEEATQGSYSGTKLFLLTRTSSSGRLQLLKRLQ